MAYLVKPFTKADLVPAIEMAVSRFHEARALETEVGSLRDRLEVRKLLDRAKGKLQADHGLSEPEAFRWIQKTSMDRRTRMREVAEAVIEGGIRAGEARRRSASAERGKMREQALRHPGAYGAMSAFPGRHVSTRSPRAAVTTSATVTAPRKVGAVNPVITCWVSLPSTAARRAVQVGADGAEYLDQQVSRYVHMRWLLASVTTMSKVASVRAGCRPGVATAVTCARRDAVVVGRADPTPTTIRPAQVQERAEPSDGLREH